MSLQALYEQAVGSHRRGDLAAAGSLYRGLLAAAPASFSARHMLGVLKALFRQKLEGDWASVFAEMAAQVRP